MFRRPPSTAGLEKARIDALKALHETDPEDPKYTGLLEKVEKLSTLITAERPEPLNVNTALLAAANIGGIALIVSHERFNVITSKAVNFVGKMR